MTTFKIGSRILLALGASAATLGCASNTGTGALVGGGTGAGIGALAGAASGHPIVGAVIGAGAGALVGGSVGNDMDAREKQRAQMQAAPAPGGPAMGVTEVIELTKQGTPEAVIINQIRTTHSMFTLSNGDISLLQTNGVAPNVIIEMQNRRPRLVRAYPYGYPPPPPPVRIGFGFYP